MSQLLDKYCDIQLAKYYSFDVKLLLKITNFKEIVFCLTGDILISPFSLTLPLMVNIASNIALLHVHSIVSDFENVHLNNLC